MSPLTFQDSGKDEDQKGLDQKEVSLDENQEMQDFLARKEARKIPNESGQVRKKITQAINESESSEALEKPDLPVEKYRTEIIQKVSENPVTIITAETGAGKSTQVPQYLLDEGYQVVVTQPRRLAARSVAARVAQERGKGLGGEVGFRTAFERQDSPDTKLLFCTDGLQLVRELTGQGVQGKKMALVLDEVHEWNTNMEILVAWSKKQMEAGGEFKVVLMSATLDSEKLAGFFGKDEEAAPTVDVPGKLYPVEEKEAGSRELVSTTAELVKEGRNVLVFQPGKKEINETIEELEKLNLGAEILPLHGQLEPAEQQRVFKHYSKPKIVVATNVAQTSITIDDIDAVVDSGVERRIETENGVEGLYLKGTSQADCKQRRGRSGRCRPGVYVLCADRGLDERDKFPKPEIQRVRLDQMVLRLATSGLDATQLDFFHQPDRSVLAEAKRALTALGAMDSEGVVTQVGKQISKLPIDVHTGRMVVEAEKKHCIDDVLTIAACLEAGGLRDRTNNWRGLTQETKSDVLAELDLHEQAQRMKGKEMKENGIFTKAYFRSKEIRRHLADGVRRAGLNFRNGKNGKDREAILRSVAAGMVDNLYRHDYGTDYTRNGETRILGKESVLEERPNWIVGTPRNIQFKNRRGYMQTLPLLTMCSEVDPEWLIEVAPQLVEKKRRYPEWSDTHEGVSEEEYTIFNGSEVKSERLKASVDENTISVFYRALLTGRLQSEAAIEIREHNKDVRQKAETLWIRAGGSFNKPGDSEEIEIYKQALAEYQLTTRTGFDAIVPERVSPDLLKFNYDQIVSPENRAQIEKDNPLQVSLNGKVFEVGYHKSYNEDFFARTEIGLEDALAIQPAELEGIIPSGRKFILRLSDSSYPDFETTNITEMRDKIEEYRLKLEWQKFTEEHRDESFEIEIGVALPALPESEIYDERTRAQAYPAYYYSWGTFYKKWFRSNEEAEKYTKDALERKELKDAEHYYNKAYEMVNSAKRDLEEAELREDDYSGIRATTLELQEQLSSWDRKTSNLPKELITKLENVRTQLEEAQAKKQREDQEGERNLQEQVERGEILIDFRCWHRRGGMTGNGDAWVIRPDGSLREPDEKEIPRYKSDGYYVWNRVEKDELALEWGCSSQRDIEGSSEFSVRKLPTEDLTPEQQEAIKRIESEIGTMEGSFGLNHEVNAQRENLLQAVIKGTTNVSGQRLDLSSENIDYFALCGNNGINLNHLLNADNLVNWDKGFPDSCENREAQVVARIPVLDGFAEFVVYDKWGEMNVNMRFRNAADIIEEDDEEDETSELDFGESEGALGVKLREALGVKVAEVTKTEEEPKPVEPPKEKIEKPAPPPVIEEKSTFKSLEDMSEDEIYEEYENNDRRINEITTANPELEILFKQLEEAETNLAETDSKIDKAVQNRDRAEMNFGDMKKKDVKNQKEKTKAAIDQLRDKKKSLRQLIKDLKQRTQGMQRDKDRLDELRTRQEQIEEVL